MIVTRNIFSCSFHSIKQNTIELDFTFKGCSHKPVRVVMPVFEGLSLDSQPSVLDWRKQNLVKGCSRLKDENFIFKR